MNNDDRQSVGPEPDVVEMLSLPGRARLDQRLTKRMLRDQVGGSGADGKLVDRVVDRAWVVGVLRPETVQVPAYRGRANGEGADDVTDVPVLRLLLVATSTAPDRRRLVELVHRAMPRPVVLTVEAPGRPTDLALALTHVSRTDAERRTSVIDYSLTVALAALPPGALDVARRDRTDLRALHRDLVLMAATQGRPASPPPRVEEAVTLHHRLESLQTEHDAAVRDARRATSQQARITLNTDIRLLRRRIEALHATLYSRDPTVEPTVTRRRG